MTLPITIPSIRCTGRWRISKRSSREAHERGLRVITELVVNHTSDQHPWFQRSRRAKPGSPWRDFYVWSDSPEKYKEARIIFKDFEPSNWTWDPVAQAYFWHRFYSHQPDLNFDNPSGARGDLSACWISGWTWAWMGCGWTRFRIFTSGKGPRARTCRRRTHI